MKDLMLRFGNLLFDRYFPLYRPLYFFYKRISERHEYDLIRRIVKPGDSVVDVGANIGAYTHFLGRLVGRNGHVYAFEPEGNNFAHLCDNVSRFSNITPIQSAVGDESGPIKIYISQALNVDHQTYDAGDGRRSIDVPQISLDQYFSAGQQVDLMKIDVQGYEYRVLLGAQRIFVENPGMVVIMEFWPFGLRRAGFNSSSLLDFIQEMGLSFAALHHSGCMIDLSELDSRDPNQFCDLIISKNLPSLF